MKQGSPLLPELPFLFPQKTSKKKVSFLFSFDPAPYFFSIKTK